MISSGNVDVMLGGGLRHWLPKNVGKDDELKKETEELIGTHSKSFKLKSKRRDNKNLLLKAKRMGYELVFDREQMKKAAKGKQNKLLGLFSYSGMANGLLIEKIKIIPKEFSQL